MSQTSALIEEGVSDLHCRSPKYLATLVWEEYKGTEPKITGLSLSVAEFFLVFWKKISNFGHGIQGALVSGNGEGRR